MPALDGFVKSKNFLFTSGKKGHFAKVSSGAPINY